MCSKGSNEQFVKKICYSLLDLVAMTRFVFLALLTLTVVQCYGALQVQMPETAELQQPEGDLQSQVRDLQKNVTDIWTYIYELRNAVSSHLNHLRQHQVELETSMHKMEHLHESELRSSDSHHHSGEHHSHSGEHHSHSGEHSHGGDHSHSGEHHSHSGEQHSHSGEHHSHGDEHGHHSHSHSHSSHDHSMEDHSGHSHGGDHHDHKDSHETEDLSQQTQQVAGPPPVAEPVVTATNRQEHYHHHHHGTRTSQFGDADGLNLMNENFHSRHNHHHHDSGSRKKNRTVEIPKYSDYGLYDLALCDVTPNRAIPEEQQQNIVGTITAWQKKTGGPLNLHVRLQGFNMGDHHGHHQSVQQEEDNETPQAVGHKHGFHVHTSGDLSNGCQSTGPHYNPKGVKHGGPNALERHVGDLGSIECDEHGVTDIVFSDDLASLGGPYSIIGKSIVIHALQDDLGLGGNEESAKTGNAGTRLACCVIRKVDKIPLRQLKAIKFASQYQNR